MRIAVFVDADNVPATVMPKLFKILKERGNVVTCKVFGDFSMPNLAPWKEACLQYGELEAVVAWRKKGKNSSDMKMCQACTHTLYTHPNIQTFVLVTGDGDFTTVVRDLKQHEKSVICGGLGANSSAFLRSCCDEFIELDKKDPRAAEKQAVVDAVNAEFDKEGIDQLNCGGIKVKLLRLNPRFTEANFGAATFTELLQNLGFTVFRNENNTPYCARNK